MTIKITAEYFNKDNDYLEKTFLNTKDYVGFKQNTNDLVECAILSFDNDIDINQDFSHIDYEGATFELCNSFEHNLPFLSIKKFDNVKDALIASIEKNKKENLPNIIYLLV